MRNGKAHGTKCVPWLPSTCYAPAADAETLAELGDDIVRVRLIDCPLEVVPPP
jgi:hypothetical protein